MLGVNRMLRFEGCWTPFSLALLLALALSLPLSFPAPLGAADQTPSQCVACHTDAAKLKALTPPDPAPAEEGEG
jgi:hypothetical protein